MVYFLHQTFFARCSWEARWQRNRTKFPLCWLQGGHEQAVQKFHSFFGTLAGASGSSCPLCIPRRCRATRVHLLTEEIWPQCPEKTGLCSECPSFYLCEKDSNKPWGEITLPTSAIVFLWSLLEKHCPIENELKDRLTPSLSPSVWDKILVRVKLKFNVIKRYSPFNIDTSINYTK